MSHFQIVFSGQLVPGASLEQTQANLAKLFRADAERIATLFSGRRVTIKGNLDASEAEKYRVTLARAGALVEVVAEELAEAAVEPASTPAPVVDRSPQTEPAQPVPGRLQVKPRDEYMAAFAAVDAPDFGVAPLGVDLQDAYADPQPPKVDLSQFSLAPVGSDMGQAAPKPAGAIPDISHLRLLEP